MNPVTKAISAVAITLLLFSTTTLMEAFGDKASGNFWSVAPVDHSTVRLHVIADSNDPASQSFKMDLVRKLQNLLVEDKSNWVGSNPLFYLEANKEKFEQQLQQYADTRLGSPVPISVSLGREHFPLRSYGRFIYPPGEYNALKVVIGAGQGDNWWCLLFPPLCLPYAEAPAAAEVKVSPDCQVEGPENSDASCQTGSEHKNQRAWKSFIGERIERWFRSN